jgi:hypothetical protein
VTIEGNTICTATSIGRGVPTLISSLCTFRVLFWSSYGQIARVFKWIDLGVDAVTIRADSPIAAQEVEEERAQAATSHSEEARRTPN